jgi:hypothetical protein
MVVATFFLSSPMRHREPDPSRPAWAPLLVLGLSVLASVTFISAGMALVHPEPETVARGTSAHAGAAPGEAGPMPAQFPPSASRNTRVRSASAG